VCFRAVVPDYKAVIWKFPWIGAVFGKAAASIRMERATGKFCLLPSLIFYVLFNR
jgi:hypothetical protein